ncbi:MAG: hypothetical protein KME21_29020 [Desmonostoc vinosum HA7617-LM4]|jgi:hypothetical protein|nr:hypothetical protein [Desmonostoc vinosum HA7617-LM4]
MFKIPKTTASVLACSFLIASCQSPAEAQSKKRIDEIVRNTPALYKVSWEVCGTTIASFTRKLRNQCQKGSKFVWGPAGEYEIVRTNNYTTGIDIHLFVKSRGCLILGNPTAVGFYKMKGFYLGRRDEEATLPKPTANVKVEQLSTQQKRQAIADFITKPAEVSIQGIASEFDCQSKESWQKN